MDLLKLTPLFCCPAFVSGLLALIAVMGASKFSQDNDRRD